MEIKAEFTKYYSDMRTVGTLFRNIDTRDVFYIDWWLGSDISCQRASASFSKAVTVNKPAL